MLCATASPSFKHAFIVVVTVVITIIIIEVVSVFDVSKHTSIAQTFFIIASLSWTYLIHFFCLYPWDFLCSPLWCVALSLFWKMVRLRCNHCTKTQSLCNHLSDDSSISPASKNYLDSTKYWGSSTSLAADTAFPCVLWILRGCIVCVYFVICNLVQFISLGQLP